MTCGAIRTTIGPERAAAIANAVANATGRRMRALPFTPEKVKQALA